MSAARKLNVVPNELPDPPYPGDVRARGWGFNLQVERIKQSTTWTKCKPRDMRAYLLRLWMESWQQSPCGTLPNDDEEVADLIELDADVFAIRREVLMRGWYLAGDGRLYHPVVTELVEEMRNGRKRERDRKAAQREKTALSHGTPPESSGSPSDSAAGPGPGPGPGKNSSTKSSPSRKRSFSPAELVLLMSAGVDAKQAGEWLAVRAKKKLLLTETAMEGLQREAAKAGMTVPAAVTYAIERSWGGFSASWVENERAKAAGGKTSLTPFQAGQRSRIAEMTGGRLGAAPHEGEVIDG